MMQILLLLAALVTTLTFAELECPEATLYCSNGGDILPDNCMTRPGGPYERQRTTVCNCSEGYAGPACQFVTDTQICSANNMTLLQLPSPNQMAYLGCQIDDDMSSEILNLIDHYAYIDMDLEAGAMTLGIESRGLDGGYYSDVAEIVYCSLSQCESEFDREDTLSSTFCEVLPGDCVGAFLDDLFLASLNGVVASFVKADDSDEVQVSVALQSIYVLPLNMQCMAGHCGYNQTTPSTDDNYYGL